MITVSSREFRSKQKSYLDEVAQGKELLVTRGKNEAFKITKVTEDDSIIDKKVFFKQLEEALCEIRTGKMYRMEEGESLDDFLDRMEGEGNVQTNIQ